MEFQTNMLICTILLAALVPLILATTTECFYEVQRMKYGNILLAPMYCEYGCCGTTENQQCCEKPHNTWMTVGIVMAVILGVCLMLIATYCIIKKINKKNVQVGYVTASSVGRSNFAGRDLPNIYTLSSNGAPPSYNYLYPQATNNTKDPEYIQPT